MVRKTFSFILVATLIFLVSCGIPSIYVPSSSDIAINSNKGTGVFTVTLSSTVREEMSSSYPDIYFFYTISSGAQDSQFSSLVSAFNKAYCSDTSGSIDFSSYSDAEAVSTYKSNDLTYGIYKLNNLKPLNISGENSVSYTLSYDSSSGYLKLIDNSTGETAASDISRINNHKFDKNYHGDITDYSESSIYFVKVYVVVSCQFNLYSNIYNTTISQSSPILQFELYD